MISQEKIDQLVNYLSNLKNSAFHKEIYNQLAFGNGLMTPCKNCNHPLLRHINRTNNENLLSICRDNCNISCAEFMQNNLDFVEKLAKEKGLI